MGSRELEDLLKKNTSNDIEIIIYDELKETKKQFSEYLKTCFIESDLEVLNIEKDLSYKLDSKCDKIIKRNSSGNSLGSINKRFSSISISCCVVDLFKFDEKMVTTIENKINQIFVVFLYKTVDISFYLSNFKQLNPFQLRYLEIVENKGNEAELIDITSMELNDHITKQTFEASFKSSANYIIECIKKILEVNFETFNKHFKYSADENYDMKNRLTEYINIESCNSNFFRIDQSVDKYFAYGSIDVRCCFEINLGNKNKLLSCRFADLVKYDLYCNRCGQSCKLHTFSKFYLESCKSKKDFIGLAKNLAQQLSNDKKSNKELSEIATEQKFKINILEKKNFQLENELTNLNDIIKNLRLKHIKTSKKLYSENCLNPLKRSKSSSTVVHKINQHEPNLIEDVIANKIDQITKLSRMTNSLVKESNSNFYLFESNCIITSNKENTVNMENEFIRKNMFEIKEYTESLTKQILNNCLHNIGKLNPEHPKINEDLYKDEIGYQQDINRLNIKNSENLKIFVLIGEAACGKTSLINRIINCLLENKLEEQLGIDSLLIKKHIVIECNDFGEIYYFEDKSTGNQYQFIETPGLNCLLGNSLDEENIKKCINCLKNINSKNFRIIFVQKSDYQNSCSSVKSIHEYIIASFSKNNSKKFRISYVFTYYVGSLEFDKNLLKFLPSISIKLNICNLIGINLEKIHKFKYSYENSYKAIKKLLLKNDLDINEDEFINQFIKNTESVQAKVNIVPENQFNESIFMDSEITTKLKDLINFSDKDCTVNSEVQATNNITIGPFFVYKLIKSKIKPVSKIILDKNHLEESYKEVLNYYDSQSQNLNKFYISNKDIRINKKMIPHYTVFIQKSVQEVRQYLSQISKEASNNYFLVSIKKLIICQKNQDEKWDFIIKNEEKVCTYCKISFKDHAVTTSIYKNHLKIEVIKYSEYNNKNKDSEKFDCIKSEKYLDELIKKEEFLNFKKGDWLFGLDKNFKEVKKEKVNDIKEYDSTEELISYFNDPEKLDVVKFIINGVFTYKHNINALGK